MMTLKGEWNSETSYNVEDTVRYIDDKFYILHHPCSAGTICTDTLYWNPLPDPLAQCAKMIMDIAANIPGNISSTAISLMDGDDEFLITVDGSGDSPELEITKVEEET